MNTMKPVLTAARRPVCLVCQGRALQAAAAGPQTRLMQTRSTQPTQPMRAEWAARLTQQTQQTQQTRGLSSASSSAPESTSPATPPAPATTPLPFYALFPQSIPQGPPPAGPFAVDLRALKREFLRLQAVAHPDFSHAAGRARRAEKGDQNKDDDGDEEHRRAEAASAHINEAYRTLASPLLRARYLLRMRYGTDLAGDEGTVGGAGGTGGRDMELLLVVMEAREAIEAAETEADLAPVRAANDARRAASEAAVGAALAADDGAAAREETVRLRYWTSIEETLREWEPGRGAVMNH